MPHRQEWRISVRSRAWCLRSLKPIQPRAIRPQSIRCAASPARQESARRWWQLMAGCVSSRLCPTAGVQCAVPPARRSATWSRLESHAAGHLRTPSSSRFPECQALPNAAAAGAASMHWPPCTTRQRRPATANRPRRHRRRDQRQSPPRPPLRAPPSTAVLVSDEVAQGVPCWKIAQ